jgi:adenine-specific DNA methylase
VTLEDLTSNFFQSRIIRDYIHNLWSADFEECTWRHFVIILSQHSPLASCGLRGKHGGVSRTQERQSLHKKSAAHKAILLVVYGEAEVLATAKALSVSGLDDTRILHSRAGKVRLLRRDELSSDWNPANEPRLTVWAVTQHLIRSLDKNGETATAKLAGEVGGLAEIARDLAYRLYILSERKGWTEEAGYYNSLVVAWPAIAPKAFVLS